MQVYISHADNKARRYIVSDLNPWRSAGTERFMGEEIAQRCAPECSAYLGRFVYTAKRASLFGLRLLPDS